jgi:hypothetical protein
MLLGNLRATRQETIEGGVPALPHILPVSEVPPLPDKTLLYFLYPPDSCLFQRYEFPQNLRELLTRDYLRTPILIPLEHAHLRGRVRFRARLMELREGPLSTLAALDKKTYDAHSARGLTLFLSLAGEEEGFMEESMPGLPPPQGSLFVEARVPSQKIEEREKAVKQVLRSVACELFPGERREHAGEAPSIDHESEQHFHRFRNRWFAFIYGPLIAVYRLPGFLSLYMPVSLNPATLDREEAIFERAFSRMAELLSPAHTLGKEYISVDFTHCLSHPFWQEAGALQNELFATVLKEYPFLKKTVDWLLQR